MTPRCASFEIHEQYVAFQWMLAGRLSTMSMPIVFRKITRHRRKMRKDRLIWVNMGAGLFFVGRPAADLFSRTVTSPFAAELVRFLEYKSSFRTLKRIIQHHCPLRPSYSHYKRPAGYCACEHSDAESIGPMLVTAYVTWQLYGRQQLSCDPHISSAIRRPFRA